MIYEARRFVPNSYEKNDSFAKDLFIGFIQRKGHKIISKKEDYNHDLITSKNGTTYFFELEVKTNYPFTTRDSFKFGTVSFLGRKMRLHQLQPFYYVIICRETSHALMCRSDKIYKPHYAETLNINTSDRTGADQMFRVPKMYCRFFSLNE